MSGETDGQALNRVLNESSDPRSITVDQETEFQSRAHEEWAHRCGIQLEVIWPGKLLENAFVESFNCQLRDEWLNARQRWLRLVGQFRPFLKWRLAAC
jgi:putative transposase